MPSDTAEIIRLSSEVVTPGVRVIVPDGPIMNSPPGCDGSGIAVYGVPEIVKIASSEREDGGVGAEEYATVFPSTTMPDGARLIVCPEIVPAGTLGVIVAVPTVRSWPDVAV